MHPAVATAGITGFLLLARPAGVRRASGSGIVRSAAAVPAGPHMELRLPSKQLQPGTNYQLAVHYVHTDAGAPNPLLSTPAMEAVRTPDPTNPTVVSVTALDPAAVPACRERGAAYTAAGCNDVTIVVAPPESAAVRAGARALWSLGGRVEGRSRADCLQVPHLATHPCLSVWWFAHLRSPARCLHAALAAVTSYTVVCKRCDIARRRSSQRRLLGALNPCTMPPNVTGLGEAMPDGKVGVRQCTSL